MEASATEKNEDGFLTAQIHTQSRNCLGDAVGESIFLQRWKQSWPPCENTTKERMENTERAVRIAWWVKAFAAKSENLSSIFRTHLVEGGNQLPQVFFWPSLEPGTFEENTHACMHAHTYTPLNVYINHSYSKKCWVIFTVDKRLFKN